MGGVQILYAFICLPKRNSRNEAVLGARWLVLQKVGGIRRGGKKESDGGVAETCLGCSECSMSVVPPDLMYFCVCLILPMGYSLFSVQQIDCSEYRKSVCGFLV